MAFTKADAKLRGDWCILAKNSCKNFRPINFFNTMPTEAQKITDGEQWEELLSFRPRIFGLCQRHLSNEDKARDATQDILVKLKANSAQHDPALPLERWVMRCTTKS